jgi:hypothetical protein
MFRLRLVMLLSLVAGLLSTAGGGLRAAQTSPLAPVNPAPTADHVQVAAALRNVAVMFIENVGQFDHRARFQMRGGSGTLWLAEDALWITVLEQSQRNERPDLLGLRDPGGLPADEPPRRGVNIKFSFVGANPHPRLEPFHRLDTHVSYFLGDDPARWRADVPVWGGVRYRDLYPGIDLELSGGDGQWQPRLVAEPGAEVGVVRLRIEGNGDAVEETGELALLQTYPLHPFPASATSPAHTPSGLIYSTFLGGDLHDYPYAIAVDAEGAAYITGETWSWYDFPTTPGAFQTHSGGGSCNWPPEVCPDAFVAKLNATGSGLVYATYLGGTNRDAGGDIVVDASGAAYLSGYTYGGFPVTPGAFQTTFGGGICWGGGPCPDAFAAKLSADGSALVYSTYLGGDWEDYGGATAVDASGNAYQVGTAGSTNFPTTPGAFQTTCGGDAFVTKLNAVGSALVYSTCLGGGNSDGAASVAVDAAGDAYVTGQTYSTNFPTTPGAYQATLAGWSDVFVTKLNASGSALLYSTYIGGNNFDSGFASALDTDGSTYLTGYTTSTDYPTTPGAFQTMCGGCPNANDAFVTKLDAAGSALTYSTFLGGIERENGLDIASDASGAAYVTGFSLSSNFPTTPGAFQTTYGGSGDVFVTKLNATGSGLAYSTFLGGSGGDLAYSIALDTSGVAYMTGFGSPGFPITAGAFQTTPQGGADGIVTKLELVTNPLTPTPTLTSTPLPTPTPTVTATPIMWPYRLYLPLILHSR